MHNWCSYINQNRRKYLPNDIYIYIHIKFNICQVDAFCSPNIDNFAETWLQTANNKALTILVSRNVYRPKLRTRDRKEQLLRVAGLRRRSSVATIHTCFESIERVENEERKKGWKKDIIGWRAAGSSMQVQMQLGERVHARSRGVIREPVYSFIEY